MNSDTGEHDLEAQIEAAVNARLARVLEMLRHELRTPLGSIITLSELMQGPGHLPPAEQAHYLDAVRQSAETALGILQTFTGKAGADPLAELSDGALVHKAFSMNAFLAGIEAHHREQARLAGLGFSLQRGADLPERLVAPMSAWRQMLDNLLANAVKFTPQGEVRLDIARREGQLVFRIADTGPGLGAAGGAALFAPGARGANAEGRKGHGLGLAVVERLSRRCGGHLTWQERPQGGTLFELALPFETAGRRQRGAPETAGTAEAGGKGRRILVVEDNSINRMLIQTLLEKFGHRLSLAPDGAEALKLARRHSFDLVLMDIEIPGSMDGFETTRALRSLPGWEHVPVLALSAHDGAEMQERLASHAMNGFVAKPLSARALYAAIEAACEPLKAQESG